MADRNNLIETIELKTRQASVDLKQGDWLQSNGAGEFIPLTPGAQVAGLCLENVNASLTPTYASEGLISVDQVNIDLDLFLMDVSVGVATTEMEGLTFDVDPADASTLDVSTAGTQFIIVRYITASKVEVKLNKCCDTFIS